MSPIWYSHPADIKVGPWSVDASKAFYTRTLTFQTPIQSRLVRRNSCDVRMVQKLVLRSPRELWLDTSNFISGTPYAEDFTVEAKWRFTADEADKTTHLVVFLEMNWAKTPMAITKSTQSLLTDPRVCAPVYQFICLIAPILTSR